MLKPRKKTVLVISLLLITLKYRADHVHAHLHCQVEVITFKSREWGFALIDSYAD